MVPATPVSVVDAASVYPALKTGATVLNVNPMLEVGAVPEKVAPLENVVKGMIKAGEVPKVVRVVVPVLPVLNWRYCPDAPTIVS